MDIKEQVNKIVEKVTSDKELQKQFTTDPIGAVESAAGIEIPDEVKNQVVTAVKAKLGADKVAGIADGLKKLF